MIIIGIDPGYDRLGLAVFQDGRFIYSNCLNSDSQLPFAERLNEIGRQLEEVFRRYPPVEVALEEVYFSRNRATAFRVAEARGVIAYIAAKKGASIHHYQPQTIKTTVTGYGQAGKNQVIKMIEQLVSFTTPPRYDDEYDAIAIGLTHLKLRPQDNYPQLSSR